MKKYVIITPSIINMGGAQMYVRNKCTYMQRKGWAVDLFSTQRGSVCIHDLIRFNVFTPELGYGCYLYPKRKRDYVVNSIAKRILDSNYEEIVIESTCLSEATWAELIARKCNARHLFYSLQEKNQITSPTLQEFVIFKHNRRELVGIAQESLFQMFQPFSPIPMEKSYRLPAHCTNVVENIPTDFWERYHHSNYDYAVGCISRLDKPFIIPAVTDFIQYAQNHSEQKFLFVMIGGAPDGSSAIKKIRSLVKSVSNVDLFITGYLFPIPEQLLTEFDAFISSAGSAWVCMRSGIPSVSYDANDFRPIGVMGRTTRHSLFRDVNEPPLKLSDLLNDILINQVYTKQPSIYETFNIDLSLHDEFLVNMANTIDYFDFECRKLTAEERKISFGINLIGPTNYTKLGKIKHLLT